MNLKVISYHNGEDIKKKDIKAICKKCYDLLNGNINPMNPARRIDFVMHHDVEIVLKKGEAYSSIAATANLNTIMVDIVELKKLVAKKLAKGNTLPDMRGLFLMTIAHELSHLDQYVRRNNVSDVELMGAEWANELHAREYVEANHMYLEHELGAFCLNFSNSVNWYDENNPEFHFPKVAYQPISNIYDKLELIFLDIFRIDPKKLFDGGCTHVEFLLYNEIRKYNKWFDTNFNIVYREHSLDSFQIIYDFLSFMNDEFYIGYKWDVRIKKFQREGDPKFTVTIMITSIGKAVGDHDASYIVYNDPNDHLEEYCIEEKK